MHEAAVTAADIARLAGVGRAAVSNWRRRYEDFPKPVGGTATSPLFLLTEVEHWLAEQGKLHEVSPWERTWRLLDAYRGDAELLDMLGAVGSFLVYLRRGGQDAWPRLAALADDALCTALPQAISAVTDQLPGIGPVPVKPDVNLVRLLRDVAGLAGEHGAVTTFEEFWERFVQASSRWVTVTPPELAKLMIDLAPAGVVLDPACGTGTLLVAAGQQQPPPHRLVGQEIDPGLARVSAVRVALREVPGEVRPGDALLADAFPGLLAHSVVCNPPFNERHWGHEELGYDPRWEYGLPAKMESELAWVQHSLAHTTPGGTVVMLMPPAVASRRSGRRIRAELLRRGALRAVVALPPGVLSSTPLALHLWILRRPQPGVAAPSGLLVVDAEAAGRTDPQQGRVDWDQASELVRRSWWHFDRDPASVPERPGVLRVVPVIDLLGDEVDLTPARNLPVSSAPVSVEVLLANQRDLLAKLVQLAPALPMLDPVAPGRDLGTMTSVADLIRAGALAMHQGGVVPAGSQDDADAVPLLEIADLMAGTAPAARIARAAAVEHGQLAEPGDVVVPLAGSRLVVRVLGAEPLAIGRGLCLLRPNTELLDPWFLAGFLRSSVNSRQASTQLSSASRLDVRRCELPRLPLAQQHGYAEIFRQLGTFEDLLGRAADLASRVVQATVDGLAEGMVGPS